MANRQSTWTELNSNLEQDIPITAQLLELLQSERKSLEERDYEVFQQTLERKKTLLQALENHAATRQQLLTAAGFKDEKSTLDAAGSEAPQVANAWRTLQGQWQQCQELNETNERIAQRTRLVAGQILDLLRGTTGETRLYDSKGGTRPSGGGHTITSA